MLGADILGLSGYDLVPVTPKKGEWQRVAVCSQLTSFPSLAAPSGNESHARDAEIENVTARVKQQIPSFEETTAG